MNKSSPLTLTLLAAAALLLVPEALHAYGDPAASCRTSGRFSL